MRLVGKLKNFITWLRGQYSRLVYAFWLSLLCLSLYSTANESLLLHFVQPLDKGLATIGRIRALKGSLERRTFIDTLRLPIGGESVAYDGDLIATGESVVGEVALQSGVVFVVQPNSLIRVRINGDKPLIKLSKGVVSVEASSESVLLAQVGSQVKEVTIQKGTHLIKNDQSFGIQITAFATQTNIGRGTVEGKRTRARIKKANRDGTGPNVEEENEGPDNEKPDSEGEEAHASGEHPRPEGFAIPYPPDDAVLLVRTPQDLALASQLVCPDNCKLRVRRNSQPLLLQDFIEGESAVGHIPASDLTDGDYEWTFDSETDQHTGHFHVKRFDNKSLNEAIASGSPVEVM